MAKVYLDAADTTFTLSNAATVYGAAGDQKLIVNEGVTGVVVDQLVERVDLPGSFADFTYKQAGNGLQVYDGTTLIATIPLQADGTQIVTSAGSVLASLTAGVMTLGGSTVSDVAAGAVVPAPTAIDATVTTGSTFVPVPTFSVTGPATAVEGKSAVYTVNLSTAQATATTVEVALSGTATPSTTTVLGDFGSLTGNMTIAGATLGADGKTLTFAAGVTSASITVPVNFDTTTETGETLIATLANPSAGAVLGTGAGSATITLQDALQPAFALTSNAVAGTPTQEGSTIAFTVTPASVVATDTTMSINLTGAAVGGVSSTALPADFTPNSTTVTFKAGDTAAKTVNVTVVADSTSEGLEGYKASLLGTGFTEISSTTGTINDPVPALTLIADKTAVDEGSSVTYTVTSTLAAPTGGIVVPYTLG
ncbi:Calx-beta domain-containing protein, partial [Chromatium okenii]|uniref:Calx-beta domain-containing protein n=1 Tax=Chromatium okenii TaxID=61644 RepID=UPI0026EDCE0D